MSTKFSMDLNGIYRMMVYLNGIHRMMVYLTCTMTASLTSAIKKSLFLEMEELFRKTVLFIKQNGNPQSFCFYS